MRPKPNSNELKIVRVYDAPIEKVWDAWTDPKQKAKWWGPRGFSITTKSKDLKSGGQWIYTMHGPDGVDYPNVTTFFIVEPLKRLEYDHGANENQKALFRVNVLFSEDDGMTTMNMTMTFDSSEKAKELSHFIKTANGNSTWDRLGEYIDETVNHKNIFLLNRVFETSIEKIFEMFTDPVHIEKWQPPTGFGMKILAGKVEEGNSVFYEMGNHEVQFFGRSSYQVINRPTFISFIQEFCNDKGQNAKHPGSSSWPARWLTSATFTKEEDSLIRLTLKSELMEHFTAEELKAFMDERGGMSIGWNGSLDRLEEALDRI